VLTSLLAALVLAQSPLLALSPKTGAVQDFPAVRGSAVNAIADDGQGGFVLGGTFSSVGGVACRNLAHVRADGTVDPAWCPRPDGGVRAVARYGDTIYLGGLGIAHVGGAARHDLAAVSLRTGRALPWNPGAAADVLQLTVDVPRRQLLVTGEFGRLGGARRDYLGAVSLATGRATAFAPQPDATSHGDSVFGSVSARGAVYAFGFFSRIGGLARDAFSRLDPRSGRALPSVVSPICPTALLALGPRLYAGTDTSCEGVKRPLIAMSLPDLKPVPLPRSIPRRHVEALAAGPGLLVAAAANDHFSATEPRVIVGLDPNGHRRFTSPVHPRGPVAALGANGNVVLVGLSR
jgi:hypothetical protein